MDCQVLVVIRSRMFARRRSRVPIFTCELVRPTRSTRVIFYSYRNDKSEATPSVGAVRPTLGSTNVGFEINRLWNRRLHVARRNHVWNEHLHKKGEGVAAVILNSYFSFHTAGTCTVISPVRPGEAGKNTSTAARIIVFVCHGLGMAVRRCLI